MKAARQGEGGGHAHVTPCTCMRAHPTRATPHTCGSTMSGQRLLRVMSTPFSVLKPSVGSPWMAQSRTLTGSARKPATSNASLSGMCSALACSNDGDGGAVRACSNAHEQWKHHASVHQAECSGLSRTPAASRCRAAARPAARWARALHTTGTPPPAARLQAAPPGSPRSRGWTPASARARPQGLSWCAWACMRRRRRCVSVSCKCLQ